MKQESVKLFNIYKMKFGLIGLGFLLLVLSDSCKKAAICDCFKGSGKTVTESRSIAPFQHIELHGKVDLRLHNAPDYHVTVTSGEKLIGKVTTEVKDGLLRIDNENKCNWVRNFDNQFEVNVYSPPFYRIFVNNSSGNVYMEDTLINNEFFFESWGSTGNYYLKLNCGTTKLSLQTGPASLNATGKTSVAYLRNSGGGRFDALQMNADDIYSTNNGTNDLLLYPNKLLDAVIGFSGDIYYKGNPMKQILKDNGTGKFIPLH